MPEPIVVVDDTSLWRDDFPQVRKVTARDYLASAEFGRKRAVMVINLCRDQRYQSLGYYCSLLAEARGHRVLPSVRTGQDLTGGAGYVAPAGLDSRARRYLNSLGENRAVLDVYFGEASEPALAGLARDIFDIYRAPLLRVTLERDPGWRVTRVRWLPLHRLRASERPDFAEACAKYLTQRWREPRRQARYRYDLALLHDPAEVMPPSNKRALRKFVEAGRRQGLDVELITPSDYGRIAEFDALFIRATTSVKHYTYRFARRAEREGMVVMDDPTSILRCSNKVYLAELLRHHRVPTPVSVVLTPDKLDEAERQCGYPVILKVPDGAFSLGVFKATNRADLERICGEMFERSDLVLAQEFRYTAFDWRVGVLNNKALFVSKYFMAPKHWQIYKHGGRGTPSSGDAVTLAVEDAPRAVVDTALKATALIGNGLYGVDLKEDDKGVVQVIEVNDNPNLDVGVEDLVLKDGLFDAVMGEFRRRLDSR